MADLKELFLKASEDVKKLNYRPSNDELLELYAFYKQGTEGDVKGARPGMLDIKGKAKYNAWAKLKGQSTEASMTAYVAAVTRLLMKT